MPLMTAQEAQARRRDRVGVTGQAVAVSDEEAPSDKRCLWSSGTIEYNAHINVAQAEIALEGGLITPTLKDADSTSRTDLSSKLEGISRQSEVRLIGAGPVPG